MNAKGQLWLRFRLVLYQYGNTRWLPGNMAAEYHITERFLQFLINIGAGFKNKSIQIQGIAEGFWQMMLKKSTGHRLILHGRKKESIVGKERENRLVTVKPQKTIRRLRR